MLLYCVKCGDPIEKDELICDKCGYHFKIVEGSPATVYMDQVPGKAGAAAASSAAVQNAAKQGQPMSGYQAPQSTGNERFMPRQGNTAQGQPMQGGPMRTQGQPMQGGPMGAQGQPMQGRPMGAQGQPMQGRPMGAQGQPMQGRPMGVQGQPMQGRPMGAQGQPPMRPVQAKPKKKKKGWLIGLGIAGGGVFVAGMCAVLFLTVFIATGLLMDDGEEIVVNDYSNPESSTTETTAPIVYDNSDVELPPEDDYVAGAIREPFVTLKGDNQDTVTVMIYMNGSNLESDHGMATEDIREILNATLSENVNVVIQTGGTRRWKTKAIASDHSQRFLVENGALTLVDDSLGQLDITDPQTLEDFIVFCDTYYPADRNMLIMWNHGSGAVYGFGYDENVYDYTAALTLDEMQTAIRNSGVKFEMIGFDACLMGGLETACAFYDSADYLIASEDFESGRGWEYQNWLTVLGMNSSTPMEDIGKIIVDDFVKESQSYGSEGILALIDLRYTRLLFQTWIDFAYSAHDDLLECNYSMEMSRSDRASLWFYTPGERIFRAPWEDLFGNDNESVLKEYNYAVDLMALAETLSTEEAEALKAALSRAMVYCSSTAGDAEMTGLSITLPYNSERFYNDMEEIYTNCGFDEDYISFLETFVDAEVQDNYDWGQSEWGGWETYEEEEEEYNWEDWDQWDEYQENDFGWDEYDYTSDWEDWY